MSTNYNRIKVADLETNESNKILTTDDSGKLEFTNINAIKVDSYNALDYTDAGKALDARQGKILKDFINDINALLVSDNVNLNTIQKLVDAIEDVKASLDTILVNNLSSGGTTKALTAEMGKTLQNTKVDKAPGERLINAEEIAKLSGVSNVVTTVKTIVSTALATQNVTGFVNYINALNPVLVVGPNEIVKHTTSDTGRTFELNLRGRSFGVGEPAITASNVIEVTDFLNKDIKLSNYLSTRNDGQSPTNKVLGTDANGNLKMYTISSFPAPFLESLIADSPLPSNTGNITIKGAFFTPTMTVSIVGQTVNYVTFINDNLIKVNVTTGASEGSFSVTLNNGLSATFNNALLIVLGTVFKPISSEWTLTEPVNVVNDNVYTETYNSIGYAEWNKQFDFTKNFSIQFKRNLSPLGPYLNRQGLPLFILQKVSNSSNLYWSGFAGGCSFNSVVDGSLGNYATDNGSTYEYRWVSGIMYAYVNNVLFKTFTQTFAENLKLKIRVDVYDITDIKYIELAS
ncbi:IPT/TIG domain-containing protein [Flavobacterium sp. ASV13]|uniref:IPT/TIG domain-containing protein n=1 Tax=Flavobacterium sp. ASV13 TaxID=1506583 RepID=UPI000557F076|nr:IPT/TIG domain-containing protein [Flavobacterium sp. ASV13]